MLRAFESLLERPPCRRQDEDGAGLRQALADLAGALPVDLQKHEASGRQRIANRLHAGAVEIVVHLGVLQKLAALHHFPESLGGDEVVIAAVDFGRPGLARGVGDRESEPRLALHQRLDEAGLAGARGGGNHVQTSGFGRHGSTFYTGAQGFGMAVSIIASLSQAVPPKTVMAVPVYLL